MGAYRSLMSASRCDTIESEAREKKRKMTERSKEFRRTWDAGQGTRKKRTA